MSKKNLTLCGLFFILCLVNLSLAQAEESITITTYYPSPYGSYRELRATRIAIGDTYIDGAQYCWPPASCTYTIDDNADLVVQGRVGIGTAGTNTTLDMSGAFSVKGMTQPAVSPAGEGRIYFNSTANRFKASENAGAYTNLVGVTKYDSGWFAASTATTYTKAHGLGAVPDIVQLWYSDTSDGSGDVVLCGSADYAGANVAIIIDIDSTNIKTRGQTCLADYYDAGGTRRWPASGYLRIVALKI